VPASGSFRVERLAQQLIALLGDRMVDALRPRLREVAVRHFDWRVRAAAMERAYPFWQGCSTRFARGLEPPCQSPPAPADTQTP
jgi:hypothetical protein